MTPVGLALAAGTAASAVTLLVRWGVWRWLCALAAVPGAVTALSVPPTEAATVLGIGVGLVLAGWRWPGRRVLGVCGLVVVLLSAVLGRLASDPASLSTSHAWTVLFAVSVLLGAAAMAGLARSRSAALRAVTTLVVTANLLGWSITGSAAVVAAWSPVLTALALTALLRGARGRGTQRPQRDDVDAAALADFAARHGRPELGPVAIVIAAYNEEHGLGEVLHRMPATVLGLATDVVVVDDGSSDATTEAATAAGSAYVVRCPANRGQGAALRLGYRVAREHGAAYVITTDADGQYDVGDMPALLSPIVEGRADFVTGSRRLGHQPVQDPLRRVGVHVFAWVLSALTGHWVTDTSFGLRAMRAEVTAAVTLNQPQYQSSELLIGVLSHGYRVLEVPGTMHARAAGASKKGPNWVYGRRYAGVVLSTWWREGCPTPVASSRALLRSRRSAAS